MTHSGLRRELILGLALVVGSTGALAAGFCYGIHAYYTSARSTDKKLNELTAANQMIETLANLDQGAQADPRAYLIRIQDCAFQLGYFRELHAKTVASGLDPDNGEQEAGLMAQLDVELKALEAAATKASLVAVGAADSFPPVGKDPHVREAHDRARRTAEHLRLALIDDIQKSGRSSSAATRNSIRWAGFFLVWMFVLVATVLYYFRRAWAFAQISAATSCQRG